MIYNFPHFLERFTMDNAAQLLLTEADDNADQLRQHQTRCATLLQQQQNNHDKLDIAQERFTAARTLQATEDRAANQLLHSQQKSAQDLKITQDKFLAFLHDLEAEYDAQIRDRDDTILMLSGAYSCMR